ncbi:MAG: hypothetical protein ACREYC_01185 [Gammaproteobacteria bacterium]
MGEKAYAVISLYSEWEEFSKKLMMTSAFLKPVTTSGLIVPRAPGIRSEQDFRAQIAVFYKRPGQNFAVAWGTPSKFIRLSLGLQLDNRNTLAAAMGSSTSPAENLRVYRNFLAHRNPGTALQVRNLFPQIPLTAEAVIAWLAMLLPGGRSQFGVWCEDLSDVARACIR